MARLTELIDGRKVTRSEHGYFVVDGRDHAYEEVIDCDFADFNGTIYMEDGSHLAWDSDEVRDAITHWLKARSMADWLIEVHRVTGEWPRKLVLHPSADPKDVEWALQMVKSVE